MRSTLLPCLVALATTLALPRVAHADEPPADQKEQTVPSVNAPTAPPSEPAPEPVPVPEPPPPSTPLAEPPAVVAPPVMVVQPEAPAPNRRSSERRKGIAFTFVAAGVLTTTVGTLLVVTGKSTYDDAIASVGCSDHACPGDDADRANAARSQINAGGIVLVVGLASVAAGAVIWLTTPKDDRAVGIAPTPGGLAAVGRF